MCDSACRNVDELKVAVSLVRLLARPLVSSLNATTSCRLDSLVTSSLAGETASVANGPRNVGVPTSMLSRSVRLNAHSRLPTMTVSSGRGTIDGSSVFSRSPFQTT